MLRKFFALLGLVVLTPAYSDIGPDFSDYCGGATVNIWDNSRIDLRSAWALDSSGRSIMFSWQGSLFFPDFTMDEQGAVDFVYYSQRDFSKVVAVHVEPSASDLPSYVEILTARSIGERKAAGETDTVSFDTVLSHELNFLRQYGVLVVGQEWVDHVFTSMVEAANGRGAYGVTYAWRRGEDSATLGFGAVYTCLASQDYPSLKVIPGVGTSAVAPLPYRSEMPRAWPLSDGSFRLGGFSLQDGGFSVRDSRGRVVPFRTLGPDRIVPTRTPSFLYLQGQGALMLR